MNFTGMLCFKQWRVAENPAWGGFMKQEESPQKLTLVIWRQHIHASSTKLFKAFTAFYYTTYYIVRLFTPLPVFWPGFACLCVSVSTKCWSNQFSPEFRCWTHLIRQCFKLSFLELACAGKLNAKTRGGSLKTKLAWPYVPKSLLVKDWAFWESSDLVINVHCQIITIIIITKILLEKENEALLL